MYQRINVSLPHAAVLFLRGLDKPFSSVILDLVLELASRTGDNDAAASIKDEVYHKRCRKPNSRYWQRKQSRLDPQP